MTPSLAEQLARTGKGKVPVAFRGLEVPLRMEARGYPAFFPESEAVDNSMKVE